MFISKLYRPGGGRFSFYPLFFFCLVGALQLVPSLIQAQTTTVEQDTVSEESGREKSAPSNKEQAAQGLDIHHRRMLKSAIFPGWGQIENGQLWKAGIVYAGFGALIYSTAFAQDNYNTYREAYNKRIDDDTTTVDAFADRFETETLRDLRDFYRRNRDLSYIGMGLLYIANVIDAFVYSHLTTFDISDDLSMQLEPGSLFPLRQPEWSTPSARLLLTLRF